MNPNNHNENIAAGMGGGRVHTMQQQPQQPSHNDPTEALESKLQSAIALLRQSRNEAHRQHQMATNRVKLATAGVQAATDAIQQASLQLQGLQEQLTDSEPALDEANTTVQRATKEASVPPLSPK
jgi:succinate dehydrogenase/fumarate reductase flavoprotein subunit